MINVYLDDLRDCPNNFILAKDIKELKNIFKKNNINILSLDHDLGLDIDGSLKKTGYDFVKYFCENALYAKKIYIHTDNPVGRENMYQTLISAQKRGFIAKDIRIYKYPIVPNKYTDK